MNVLQEFLNRRLFEVGGDDDRLRRLDKAAAELAKTMSRRQEAIAYTLLALDPQASSTEPHAEHTMAALVKQWNAIRDHYGETPIVVIRAVAAEALRRAARSDPAVAAIVWYTAASYAPHVPLDESEAEVWKALLGEIGRAAEKYAVELWEERLGGEGLAVPMPALPTIAIRPGKLDVNALKNALVAAAGSSGGDVGSVERNPHNPCAHSVQGPWVMQMGTRSAAAISSAVNTALSKTAIDGNDSLPQALADYLGEVAAAVQRSLAPLHAARLQTRLVWWKEAEYSESLEVGYRDMDAALAALAIATDLHAQVPAYTPRSVDYFLVAAAEALIDRDPLSANELVERLAGDSRAQSLLLKGRDSAGRIPMLEYVRRGVHAGSPLGGLRDRVGISDELRLAPAAWSAWLFRDLQAQRLTTQK
jgi:hypothetical protein